MKKIVCISDTHRKDWSLNLPKGDILIYTGDFDITCEDNCLNAIDWFYSLNFKSVVWIGGNHDSYLEELHKIYMVRPVMPYNIYYLLNDSVEIDGIKIWGSPFSPQFNNWSFMGDLEELKEIWSTIPGDTDIIMTHCPPFGINDQVNGISQGCPALRDRIKEIKPKYHIHGHIHEGYGVYCDLNTIYVNASIMDEFYNPCHKPVEIIYE